MENTIRKSYFMVLGVLLLSTIFSSCGKEDVQKPEELLPPFVREWEINNQNELQNLSKEEHGVYFDFETNYDWRIEIEYSSADKDWCKLSQSEGTAGTASIGMTVFRNDTYDYRRAVVTLICKDEKRSFTVGQSGTPKPSTIVLQKAGTLRFELSHVNPEVESLTIEGDMNGDDIAALRDFYTIYYALKSLNLSRVNIVKGGSFEYKSSASGGWYKQTCNEDNVLPPNMFNACFRTLEKLVLPLSITAIGDYALGECNKLKKTLNIPHGVTKIGIGAFRNCFDLEHIILPSTLKSIASGAFWQCNALVLIEIPEGITTIESGTFGQCRNLQNIKLPESLTEIAPMAFTQCEWGLSHITIPKNVKSIGYQAFYSCKNLTSITCLAETPPQIRTIFDNGTLMYPFDEGTMMYLSVPKFCSGAYRSSDWRTFCVISELNN